MTWISISQVEKKPIKKTVYYEFLDLKLTRELKKLRLNLETSKETVSSNKILNLEDELLEFKSNPKKNKKEIIKLM